MKSRHIHTLFAFLIVVMAGCNSTTVRTVNNEAAIKESAHTPEEQLLDVGIGIFDPGVDEASGEEPGVYPAIRKAEARFIPYKMMETLQQTGNWGIVRVIPARQSEMDLWVDAEILISDGATLELDVVVEDSTGKVWFSKRYNEEASKYAYDSALTKGAEPFQGLYNQIANDMLSYRNQLTSNEIYSIRTITSLKFAKQFSPEVFNNHLGVDKNGHYSVTRLPADNDPILMKVKQIRERDYMFVDTLQEHYGSFVRQMEEAYWEWREAFYEEGEALRETRKQANQRMVGGALAVLAGILAQGSGSRTGRAAGSVGIGAGAGVFMSGLHKREEAKVHQEALDEISNSLDAEMQPHTLALENRTVTLTGTVQEQYSQWQQILREIYNSETGLPPASSAE